jgi:hypothetical protein
MDIQYILTISSIYQNQEWSRAINIETVTAGSATKMISDGTYWFKGV